MKAKWFRQTLVVLAWATLSFSCDDDSEDDEGRVLADSRCDQIGDSIAAAGFNDSVNVRCESDLAFVGASTFPSHDVMNGIVGTNEQVAMPAPDYEAPIILEPSLAQRATTRDSALGITVNGVPIYDYTAGGELEIDEDGNSDYDERLDTTF